MHSEIFHCSDVDVDAKGPTHSYPRKQRDHRPYCYASPSATPYVRRERACEHVDDSEVQHNHGHTRQECTSFNATCADDADDLLRHCLPEVYVDHSEVRKVIEQERALSLDKRFNMGSQRYSRFNDFGYLQRECSKKKPCERHDVDNNDEDDRKEEVIYRNTGDPGRIRVSAAADPFDVYPTIRAEYPVMVRRPENYAALYTKYY